MSVATTWPAATDYAAAVSAGPGSFPASALAGFVFRTAALIPGMDGEPAMASGQNAVVFDAKVAGSRQAVRCFTTAPADGRLRYGALAEHLASTPVPDIAAAHWLDDAITVRGRSWPVVTMEWVDGLSLSAWVEARLGDRAALGALADRWRDLCATLRSARVAHGDLQHGNVLVTTGGEPRLIDLDGVWIPAVAGHRPTEVGHANYQHPDRLAEGTWGEHIDWFSALVIYVSLRAVAGDPGLWELHTGENLIFTQNDFLGPAPVWQALDRNPDVAGLARLLTAGCDADVGIATDLDELLTTGLPAGSVRIGPRAEPDSAGPSWTGDGNEWWRGGEATTGGEAAPATDAFGFADVFDGVLGEIFGPTDRREATEAVQASWPTEPRAPVDGPVAPPQPSQSLPPQHSPAPPGRRAVAVVLAGLVVLAGVVVLAQGYPVPAILMVVVGAGAYWGATYDR